MSFQLMKAAWASGVPPIDRLVLVALADWANEAARCWPSMPTIANKTGVDVRTARRVMKRLEDGGHITTDRPVGKGILYTVHPGHCDPGLADPGQAALRTADAPTEDTLSSNTLRTAITQKSASPSSGKRAIAKAADRYHRLPSNWTPSRPLPPSTQAKVDQWPPGHVADELATLHRWAANAENKNGKGRKLDWDAAWVNWLERADKDRRPGHEAGKPSFGVSKRVDGFTAALREAATRLAPDHSR